MFDPAGDDIILREIAGDDAIAGDPSGGSYGEGLPDIRNEIPPNVFRAFDVRSLAQNASFVATLDSEPAYWCVAVAPVASSEVIVYFGPSDAGEIAGRAYSNWALIVPGKTNQLTVRGNNAAAANVVIYAVRGDPFGLSM